MSGLMGLNDRLFRELDRLDKVDAGNSEELEAEVERARAIGEIAGGIIDNAKTLLAAEKLRQNAMMGTAELVVVPQLLEGGGE